MEHAFQTAASALREGLSTVLPVIPSRAVIAALEHLRLSLNGGVLELLGSDMEAWVRTTVPLESSTAQNNWTVLVPAKLLASLLRTLPESTLRWSHAPESSTLTIESATGRYALQTLAAEEYPSVPEPPPLHLRLDGTEFREALRRVLYAAATDDYRQVLTGVLLEVGTDGTITAVATDGYRLGLARICGEGQAEEARELLVPAALLKLVVRSAEGELRLGWDATRVCFAAGSTTIWGTLLTEQYPNWRSVIPTASTRRAVFERKSLEEALKRVALFAPHTARVVRLNFTAQGVRLSAQDEGSGHRAEEFLPCQYEGEELLIGFNAEYLQDALDALAPASAVTMFATEPNRAVMFLEAAATEGHSNVPPLEELPALALLMPMRL